MLVSGGIYREFRGLRRRNREGLPLNFFGGRGLLAPPAGAAKKYKTFQALPIPP
jgi:hypothetical protein